MTVKITGQTQVKSQTLVNFPPQPALNLNFTQGYANGLNPLPSTVTFTRADTAAVATQVGPDGLLRLAAHNIMLNSNTFTSWTIRSMQTPTTGVSDPANGTAAWTISPSAGSAVHAIYASPTNIAGTYTFSVYAKAGTTSWIALGFDLDAATDGAYFNVATGAIGTVASGTTAAIVNVGNGWFRCSVTRTYETAVAHYGTIEPHTANGQAQTWNAAGTETLFIAFSQFERNLTPSYYVPTTSAAVYANTPRFDYSPVTLEPLGLLIEESRQNIAFPSVPTSATWTVFSNATLTPVSEPAPDGSLTTPKFVSATNSTNQLITKSFTVSASTTYTLSCYIKANGYNFGSLTAYGNAFVSMTADLTTGSVTNSGSSGNITYVSSSATSAGNGWWRLTLVVTTGVGVTSINVYPGSYTANTFSGGLPTTYAGNGTSGAYFWGVQLEAGSFPTSYIPTTTVAVTRALDLAKMTGANFSSWYTQTGGTFLTVSDTVDPRTSGSPQYYGTAHVLAVYSNVNNFYDIRNAASTGSVGMASGQENATSSDFLFIYNGLAANSQVRQALAVNNNDVAFTYNGGSVSTDTSFALPTSMTTMDIGASRIDGGQVNGHIARLQYWPARFTDAQLQLITKG